MSTTAAVDGITAFFTRAPDALDDPAAIFRALRAGGPAIWVGGPPGGPPWLNAWHLIGYDAVATALRDPRLSSARDMTAPARAAGPPTDNPKLAFLFRVGRHMMITRDAPAHTRLRGLVNTAFTPRVVARMGDGIAASVANLLDAAQARGGELDVMRDLAYPLPAIVIARLLGLPETEWPMFKRWSDGLIGGALSDAQIDNFYELGRYLQQAIAWRRAAPHDDLIGGLVAARDNDDALSDDELISQLVVLLIGGHETTSYAIGNAVRRLLQLDGAWTGLTDDELPVAIEELLRYDPPFQGLARLATEDCDIGGARIQHGQSVWCWIGGANHDPARFPDPDTLHLDRADNRHLTFGVGPHFCLGAALARLELRITLTTLRQRYPTLRLTSEQIDWNRASFIRGPRTLPTHAA
ncbi:MAG: cytochrome P450 [Thermomicrobiales bacterium]|nr:cytochrome P450 [Thermomicrobiales bacterium]